MKKALIALAALMTMGAAQPQAPAAAPPLSLWRLDCGEFLIKQYGAFFSDTFAYPEGARPFVGSCYLIKHGDRYMLWDAGLPEGMKHDDAAQTITVRRSIVDQLREIGVRPEQIEIIGISHWHFDHVGQAGRFPGARLIMGRGDVEALRATPPPDEDSVKAVAHWLTGGGKLEPVSADHDVFGDGRVLMLDLPGHTPGHYALLVRLASGPVLLSGDLYHLEEQVAHHGLPSWNHSRADTLASMDRFDKIAKNLGAKVVIQHDATHVSRLPASPQPAQ